MANNTINMTDKDILADFLSSQKHIASSYNTYAGECEHTNLRDAFLCVLEDEHKIQTEIFQEMSNRGWYQVKAAEQQQIDQLKQQFNC